MKKLTALLLSIILLVVFTLQATAFQSVSIKSIKLNVLDSSGISLRASTTYKLNVSISPSNTTQRKLNYRSANSAIATVDKNGLIKAVGEGQTVITITSASNKKLLLKSKVTVLPNRQVELKVNFDSDWDVVKDPVAKYIEQKFNVKIVPVPSYWDDTTLLTAAASDNSLPDVFNIGALYQSLIGLYSKWITQGIVRDIPTSLYKKYPNVASILDKNDTCLVEKKLYKDHYLLVSPNYFYKEANQTVNTGIYYRKDWLKAVGINKVPTTYDEFYQMLKAFVNNDPDKNGKNDTIGIAADGGMCRLAPDLFANWGVCPDVWTMEGGKWIPGYMSQKNVAPLKFYQKCFKEGLIDPEFGILKQNAVLQKFAQSKCGAIVMNDDAYWIWKVMFKQFGAANPSITDPTSVIGILPPLSKDGVSKPTSTQLYDMSGLEFRADLSDEKLDRWLEIENWLLSSEGSKMCTLGVKGTTYTVDTNGNVTFKTNPATNAPYALYPYPAGSLFCYTNSFLDGNADPHIPNLDIKYKTIYNQISKERDKNIFKIRLEPLMISTPMKDQLAIDYITDFTNLVSGTESIDTAFPKLLAGYKKQGLDREVNEVNFAMKSVKMN